MSVNLERVRGSETPVGSNVLLGVKVSLKNVCRIAKESSLTEEEKVKKEQTISAILSSLLR